MKMQTQAVLEKLKVKDQDIQLDKDQTIELEFSAIDTGGGFKDPMLDFSISLGHITEEFQNIRDISFKLADPNDEDKEVSFSFEGYITMADQQVNGRIKEDQLNREVIGFVINLLR
ncbi:hypothetical protein [Fodinibius sp. SL11]|uniref:hypothetical protein n=1 Tax=Fodinibius sp. SL11 TaxID=3425690 RepID=UPI003F8803B4